MLAGIINMGKASVVPYYLMAGRGLCRKSRREGLAEKESFKYTEQTFEAESIRNQTCCIVVVLSIRRRQFTNPTHNGIICICSGLVTKKSEESIALLFLLL